MIARAYHVKLQDIVEMNNITDLNAVKEGSIIFIPNAIKSIDDVTTNVKPMNTAAAINKERHFQ